MQAQPFTKVTEAAYLTADKAWSYRAILRYFYIQHERMREFLFPEEVFSHLKELDGFQDYTEDHLHQDLNQLEKWNNLIARQEVSRAHTIEEFKKKRFPYQCTPYTVEFERMLLDMEKSGDTFGGSLERKEFERLYQALLEVESFIKKDKLPPADECAQLWNDVFSYFRSIFKNTSDYMAHINSEEAEERMQTEAFLVFKDQFTTYLRDFIIGLQQTALKIQQLLHSITTEQLKPIMEQVIIHQQQVPRFEDVGLDEAALLKNQEEKWRSLYAWFLGNEHGESQLDMLQMRTNEIRLNELPMVEPYVRKMLLSWVGKAMARTNRTFKTEYGRQVKVILQKNERAILRAEDGDIEMPAVKFRFLDEANV